MITQDKMYRLLMAAESGINRRGWEQPHMLAHVIAHREDSLRLDPAQLPIKNPPGEYLLTVAEVFHHRPEIPPRLAQDHPNLIGLAFCAESWANDTARSKEDLIKMTEGPLRLPDLVGSYEARDLSVIDVWGRVFHVQRRRGHKPQHPADQAVLFGGRVAVALAAMVVAIQPHLGRGDAAACKALFDKLCNPDFSSPTPAA